MLIAMRKGAAGWVAKILFGLLILSFAVWGIGDYLTPDANPVVAKVGEIEIRRIEVDQAERRQTEQMRRILGNQFNPADLPDGALRRAAVEQLVGQAALDMEAKALQIGISDQGVGDAIRVDPSFQQNGKFDTNRFRRSLSSAGISEEAYAQNMRIELKRKQLVETVRANIAPPLPMLEAIFLLERQKRRVSYVELDSAVIKSPEPSENDLQEYVKANAAKFAEPARRDARVIVISTSSISETIEIPETEIANHYEDTKERYRTPERRRLVQALFQNESDAREFASKAKTNKTNFMKDAESAGGSVIDLGELTRDQIFPSPLADSAFSSSEGPSSVPVSTSLGWHVLLVEKVIPESTKPLATVAADLKLEMQQEQAISKISDVANAAEDALAAGGDLASAASAAGLPIVTLNGIDRRGVNREGSVSLKMPDDPAYLASIFERNVGEQSGLIELRDGVFIALVVDKIYDSAPKPFEIIREQALSEWKDQKRLELGRARLKSLTEASSLSIFKEAAKAAKLNVASINSSMRDEVAASNKFPSDFIEKIFNARENSTVSTNIKKTLIAAFVDDIQRPIFDLTGDAEKEFIAAMTDVYARERAEALATLARTVHLPEIVADNRSDEPKKGN